MLSPHRIVTRLRSAHPATCIATFALLVAVSDIGPADAARAVKRALFAQNAGSVDGISASRSPRPGQLVALGADGRFPPGVNPPGPRGPRGPEGPRGQAGPQGVRGPGGLSNIRLANGAPIFLSQSSAIETQVTRLDNLPAGSWLLAWSATLDYVGGDAIGVVCDLQVGQQRLAVADATMGFGPGGVYASELGSFGATTQSQGFSAQLLCRPSANSASAVHVDSQRIVAIRADTLDVTG